MLWLQLILTASFVIDVPCTPLRQLMSVMEEEIEDKNQIQVKREKV